MPEAIPDNPGKVFRWLDRDVCVVIFMVLLAFSLYAPALDGPFVLDDANNIEENECIRVDRLDLKSLTAAALEGPSKGRPVPKLTFALNYYVHQYKPAGYRIVNITIHVCAAAALYFLFRLLLALPAAGMGKGSPALVAFFAAALWLVNPVQTQNVSYIVQRMNSMAGLFCVLSLFCYFKARLSHAKGVRLSLFALSLLFFALGAGSKQNAAVLPFLVVLAEWFFLQDLKRQWVAWGLAGVAISIIIGGILGWLYLGNPVQAILSTYECRDFTLGERVLTQFRVVVMYLGLLAFPAPWRLNLDYDYPLSTSLLHPPATALSLALIALILALAVLVAKRHRLAAFCVFWYFGNLVLESSVFSLELVFEHRLYMPSMFAILLPVYLCGKHLGRRPLIIAGCCLLALWSFWTWQRNVVWGDEVAINRDCVEKSGGKWRTLRNYGIALIRAGQYAEAMEVLNQAVNLDGENINRQFAMAKQKRSEGDTLAALVHEELARRMILLLLQDSNNLAYCARNNPELDPTLALDLAIGQYRRTLGVDPNNKVAMHNLGLALEARGERAEAIEQFRRLVELDGGNLDARVRLGGLLGASGDTQGAKEQYQVLVTRPVPPELVGTQARAFYGLGLILANEGDWRQAMACLEKASALLPGNKQVAAAMESLLNKINGQGKE